LEPDAKGLNLLVKVVEVHLQAGPAGAAAKKPRVSHVLVADATGSINLSIEGGGQAAAARQGNWIYVRNAHVAMTPDGHMRLRAELPWALIEVAPQAVHPAGEVKLDNNLSETEYELVVPAEATAASAAQ